VQANARLTEPLSAGELSTLRTLLERILEEQGPRE
jgi:hypothetical protein